MMLKELDCILLSTENERVRKLLKIKGENRVDSRQLTADSGRKLEASPHGASPDAGHQGKGDRRSDITGEGRARRGGLANTGEDSMAGTRWSSTKRGTVGIQTWVAAQQGPMGLELEERSFDALCLLRITILVG